MIYCIKHMNIQNNEYINCGRKKHACRKIHLPFIDITEFVYYNIRLNRPVFCVQYTIK